MNKKDYLNFLISDTKKTVKPNVIVENETESEPGYFIGPSEIHGKGVHAKKWLDKEVRVGQASNPYPNITPMGKMINHSGQPNCILHRDGDNHHLVTNRPVEPGEELTVDYSQYDEFKDPDPDWK